MSEPIRLVLIDHHTLLRRCLAAAFNRRRGFRVVGDAATGSDGLSLARSCQPDIIVVDPDMPEGGPQLIELLCEEVPTASVIALTLCHEDMAKQALLAGARGCIEKTCEPDDLMRAVKVVHAGEMVMGSPMMDTILESLNGAEPVPPVTSVLTERELEVLPLVVEGRTNAEIARELYITEHTSKGHVAKILSKLSLDNRVQLAAFAIQHGLVASSDSDLTPSPEPPDRVVIPHRSGLSRNASNGV